MNTIHQNNCQNFPLYALICAAGVGVRAGGDLPKQYQLINGQPMLWHTIAAFARCARLAHIYIVISPNDAWFQQLIAPKIVDSDWSARVTILSVGGISRADSVCNGLAELDDALCEEDDAWVLVHDAARPCVTETSILHLCDDVLNQASQIDGQGGDWQSVGGILASPVTDTIKLAQDSGSFIKKTIDRSVLWAAQTPQMFTVSRLYNALCDALIDSEVAKTITDEASVMEWAGYTPLLVRGEARNLKVTYPEDFELAGFYLRSEVGSAEAN